MKFSALNRTEIIQSLSDSHYDVLIIGGGITGAGIALDASTRGLKVALIEMNDFASGTSGKSTKLIHGGLRYLKQLEFKLVAEVGKEREIIHQMAPHLTIPEPMLLPIVRNGSLSFFTTKIAMKIYEWLAGVKKEERFQTLTKEQTLKKEPTLNSKNLLGGILFYEYRTDDARLTTEVLKEAVKRGAVALNYAKATKFLYVNEKINGAEFIDSFTSQTYNIKADYIVNAGGPWVDDLDQLDVTSIKNKLHITKGIHLVFNKENLPIQQSIYFDTPDKRMLFAIPRGTKTYVGTTDTFYDDKKLNPTITQEDVTYVLNCLPDYFPNHQLKSADIESAWSGIRPLIHKPGKGPSEISRKDELFIYKSGLITIAGGKLTGYRKMAERVVDEISNKLKTEKGIKLDKCTTESIHLNSNNTSIANEEYIKNLVVRNKNLSILFSELETLYFRYGTSLNIILELAEELQKEKHELPLLIRAQIHYTIHNEMCYTPSDFIIRRTSLLYFDMNFVLKWKDVVLNYMAEILKWDEPSKTKFNLEINESISQIQAIKNY